MKSHLDYVLAIYEGVIADASLRWPQSVKGLWKDLVHLRRAGEERGLPFFLVSLPALGKTIDRSLSESFFPAIEIPQGIKLYRKRPVLFRDLLEKIFAPDGTLLAEADIEAIFFIRQLCFLCKKLEVQCPESTTKETLNEYFEIETRLPKPWRDTWDCEVPVWHDRSGHPLWGEVQPKDQEEIFKPEDLPHVSGRATCLPWSDLRAIARRYVSEVGTPPWWDLKPRHGPGAVSEGRVVKYDFPTWPRKLGLFFAYDWFGTGQLEAGQVPSDHEPSSRLISVPKTYKGPRLIAAEPVAHQWMQQAIANWLFERVEKTLFGKSISFRSQTISREMALDASLYRDNCTIDLSSASDRLSCRLVEFLFQGSELLDGFHACRTRSLRQNMFSEFPDLWMLRKFSTQGSALTFPVQSMVFTILSVWALRLAEGKTGLDGIEKDAKRVRVFGDDIILPSIAYDAITLVLHECGLRVNDTKSHRNGYFRESCGMDAFKGYDVTPAYHSRLYDGSASSTVSVIDVTNNLFKKGLFYASNAALKILGHEAKLLPVLGPEEGGLGLFSYCGSDISHLRRVWNADLQTEQYLTLGIRSVVPKVKGSGQASLTQYFTEAPPPDAYLGKKGWSSGQAQRARVRKTRVRVSI